MEANVVTTGLLAKTKPEVIDSLNNGQGTFPVSYTHLLYAAILRTLSPVSSIRCAVCIIPVSYTHL